MPDDEIEERLDELESKVDSLDRRFERFGDTFNEMRYEINELEEQIEQKVEEKRDMSMPIYQCPDCGARDLLGEGDIVGVWDKVEMGEEPPDLVGCKNCNILLPEEEWE